LRYYGANAGSAEGDSVQIQSIEAKPTNPAIHSLVRLRADLGAQIQANKPQAKKFANQMRAIKAVIRLLDPAYNLRAISVRRRVTDRPFGLKPG
jgi:hypothetical protein